MATKKKEGYIGRFLKKADKAIDDGIKRADEALEDAVEFSSMTAKQASEASQKLRKQAEKERKEIQKKGAKKISEGISAAKGITDDSAEGLELLAKLGKLRKSGVITEKEFQAKKKKILGRI